jgi:hypothetical protein
MVNEAERLGLRAGVFSPDRRKKELGMRKRLFAIFAVMAMTLMLATAAFAGGGPHNKATGEVDWSPLEGPNIEVTYETWFDVHDDAPGGGKNASGDRGTVETTNTSTQDTFTYTIDCVIVEGDEAWFSGQRDGDGAPVIFYVKDNATPGGVFNQWTNPSSGLYPCTARWSGEAEVLSGNVNVHYSE